MLELAPLLLVVSECRMLAKAGADSQSQKPMLGCCRLLKQLWRTSVFC